MEPYSQIVTKIIKEQEAIIGPVAVEQAMRVNGLEVINADNIKITGNAKEAVANLVDQYAKLFGRASIELCKEALRGSKVDIPKDQLPEILR
jgi:hypothetical protein